MSRTRRGAKGAGYEYWSRRKVKVRFAVGRRSKTWTHRRERRDSALDLSRR